MESIRFRLDSVARKNRVKNAVIPRCNATVGLAHDIFIPIPFPGDMQGAICDGVFGG